MKKFIELLPLTVFLIFVISVSIIPIILGSIAFIAKNAFMIGWIKTKENLV